jgi:protein TonB
MLRDQPAQRHEPFDPSQSKVTAPSVLFAPEPVYNPYARAARLSGNSLIYLQIDRDGQPINVRILRPLGLGLDESAVTAVRSYRFKPAMENGGPVVVEMNVEVNFQIFDRPN